MPLITQTCKHLTKKEGAFLPSIQASKLKGETFIPDFVDACSTGDRYAEGEFMRITKLYSEK